MHGSVFVNGEWGAVYREACLGEKDFSAVGEFDEKSDGEKGEEEHARNKKRKEDIKHAFDHGVKTHLVSMCMFKKPPVVEVACVDATKHIFVKIIESDKCCSVGMKVSKEFKCLIGKGCVCRNDKDEGLMCTVCFFDEGEEGGIRNRMNGKNIRHVIKFFFTCVIFLFEIDKVHFLTSNMFCDRSNEELPKG